MFPFRKHFSFLLKLLVSGGFVAWLVFKVNWGEVAARIFAIDIAYLILYLVLLLFGIALSAWKWQIIAEAKGFTRLSWDFFRAYLTGTFINNFLPSTIGGDTYRTLWLGRRNNQLSPAISTTLFDRFTGLWAAMVFTLLFSVVHLSLVWEHVDWLLLNLFVVFSLSLDALFPFVQKFSWFQAFFQKIPERFQRLFSEMQSLARGNVLFSSLKLSLIFNFVGVGLANLILFHALGGGIRTIDYLGVIFLTSIISSLPISINNIGLKEWAYVTFFGYLGVGAETAVAVAITSRFLQMFVSFFAIPFYLRSRDFLGREEEKYMAGDTR